MAGSIRSQPTLDHDQELAADLSFGGNPGARRHGDLIHVLKKAA